MSAPSPVSVDVAVPVAPVRQSARRALLPGLVAVAVLGADQLSKVAVTHLLEGRGPIRLLGGAVYLAPQRNPAAAFNLAARGTVLVTVAAAAVAVALAGLALRLRGPAWSAALGLVLGGAVGNLTDRLGRAPGPLRGAVVDWISLFDPFGRRWPAFNLADAAVVIGCLAAIVLVLSGRPPVLRTRR